MPEFRYKAVDETGRVVKGRMSALDEEDLEARLSQKGLILVWSRKSGESILLKFSRVSPRLVIEFYNRLYQAIEIGLPLISALEEIAQGMPSKLFRKIIGDILVAVEAGNTLHEAMSRYSNIFSKLELNVIKMGEISGTLPLCLKELAGAFVLIQFGELQVSQNVIGDLFNCGCLAIGFADLSGFKCALHLILNIFLKAADA